MSDENLPPSPPPGGPNADDPMKIIWLFVAFVPSLAMLLASQAPSLAGFILPFLVVLYFVCSIAAGVGLVRGMKSEVAQFFLGILLIGFFLAANLAVVVFVSCSKMGPI